MILFLKWHLLTTDIEGAIFAQGLLWAPCGAVKFYNTLIFSACVWFSYVCSVCLVCLFFLADRMI